MPQAKLTSARAWLDRLDKSRHAMVLLFLASMMGRLLVPIPIEVILIPWMLCHPDRKWRIATVALAGNLTAATLGYYLGVFAMDQWGDALVGFFGGQEAYESFDQQFREDGFTAILAIGIVPIPFQIAMLVAGASGYPIALFLLAACIARGARYFGLALLIKFAGKAAMELWDRHAKPIGIAGLVLFAVWVWFKWFQ
jgi:membrane protein YqaA with SNARE-associated domain